MTSRSRERDNAYGVSLVVELRNLKLRPKLCRVAIKKGLDIGAYSGRIESCPGEREKGLKAEDFSE